MKLQQASEARPADRAAELSALFDGECGIDESRRLVKSAVRDEGARKAWRLYSLIGDGLRGDVSSARDLSADVMARLRNDPVVLAPRPLLVRRQHPFLALAASLAGVGVVGWLALADGATPSFPAGGLAAVPSAPTFARVAAPANPLPSRAAQPVEDPARRGDMSEYLLAHHTQAASFRLGDSTEHVRTVSVTAGVPRP